MTPTIQWFLIGVLCGAGPGAGIGVWLGWRIAHRDIRFYKSLEVDLAAIAKRIAKESGS